MYRDYFDSPVGLLEIIANDKNVLEVKFVNKKLNDVKLNNITNYIKQFLKEYFERKCPTINSDLIDFIANDFFSKVYKAVIKISHSGEILTYQQIAKEINSKSYNRIKEALVENKLNIIIPAHRVISHFEENPKIKHFKILKQLFFLEQEFIVNQKLKTNFYFNTQEITKLKTHKEFMKYLNGSSIVNKALVFQDPFVALSSRVIFQQVSNQTARQILVKLAFYLDFKITPLNLLKINESEYSNLGISSFKVKYLKNVSHFILENPVIWEKVLISKNREFIEKHLKNIKGFGKWSVWTFLLFGLKWKNVFEIDDLILKKCLQSIFNKDNIAEKDFNKFIKNYEDIGSLISINVWNKFSTGKS